MSRRFVLPGLFGSGLAMVIVAAVLWVRPGQSDVPQAPATVRQTEAKVSQSASPTAAPLATETPAPARKARTPYEEGRALFLAKGCISCHWHKQSGVSSAQSYKVGPDLSELESSPYNNMPNDAAFLRKWLKDPQAVRPGTQMPNLGLTDAEIESLVAFVLTVD